MIIKRRLFELLQILIYCFLYLGGARIPSQTNTKISFWDFVDDVYILGGQNRQTDGNGFQKLTCGIEMLRILPGNFRSSWNYAVESYRIEERTPAYLSSQADGSSSNYFLPLQQINLMRIPDAFWEHFSVFYWNTLSNSDHQEESCTFHFDASDIKSIESQDSMAETYSENPDQTVEPTAAFYLDIFSSLSGLEVGSKVEIYRTDQEGL